jgi:2-polyprenyl-6-hydroxyphenyl methylase/3-demethylubiquinone-9 3-methyltransferase
MSFQNFYQNFYADLEQGHGYDPATEPTFALRVGAALSVIGAAPKRILDFGCGAGDAAKCFVERGHDVVGVDISASGIRLAKMKVPTATFVLIDSETQLPFPDESFDIYFCTEVIEHLFYVREFIGEISRLLVKDGLFLLTTPYHGWIKNLFIITFAFEKHFEPNSGHIRFFSKRSMRQYLQLGGFRVERIHGIGRCWPVWKSMFVIAQKRA